MASPSPRSAADHPKPHPAGDAWWCKRCEVAFYGESCPGRHAHFAHTEVLPLGVRAPEWALSLYPYPPNAGDPLPHGHLAFAPGANLTIIPWGKAAGERAPLFLCAGASAERWVFVVRSPHPSGLSAARYALRAASARASGPPLTRPCAAAGDLKGTEHSGWLYAATDSGEKGLVPENYLERQVLGASRKRAAAPSPEMPQHLP